MKILFIGKGISNDGAVKVAEKLNIEYDYVDVFEKVNQNYDLIIKGPGISYDEIIIKKFILLNKKIITDIEFIFLYTKKYYIGITGSNGKTTTTSLITNILNTKYKSIACANIGYSIGDAVINNNDCTHFVCELSSFQLKGTDLYKPNIAIITNLNCCHLDYHKTEEDYFLSKKKLIINQDNNDFLIYNLDCENTKNLIKDSLAKKYSFSLYNEQADCYIKNNFVYFNHNKIININEFNEKNIQTIGNYLASIIVAFILGVNKNNLINELINFKKSKYRFEYIKSNIINDAKSTNVYSTLSAIKSINKPIILLAGGLYRNYELNKLNNNLDNIELVISYGETKNLLSKYFNDFNIKCISCNTLEEGVLHSLKYLNNNNILLYSPMFASYDLFKSYEERGELFNKLINGVK